MKLSDVVLIVQVIGLLVALLGKSGVVGGGLFCFNAIPAIISILGCPVYFLVKTLEN